MPMMQKNLNAYWNNRKYFNTHSGYVLMDVLMALVVASSLAISSLIVLSYGGSYYASVAVRKEIAVSAFSFLEQIEVGGISPTERFQKGALVYKVNAENRGLSTGEAIIVEGDLGNRWHGITIWRPFISP